MFITRVAHSQGSYSCSHSPTNICRMRAYQKIGFLQKPPAKPPRFVPQHKNPQKPTGFPFGLPQKLGPQNSQGGYCGFLCGFLKNWDCGPNGDYQIPATQTTRRTAGPATRRVAPAPGGLLGGHRQQLGAPGEALVDLLRLTGKKTKEKKRTLGSVPWDLN